MQHAGDSIAPNNLQSAFERQCQRHLVPVQCRALASKVDAPQVSTTSHPVAQEADSDHLGVPVIHCVADQPSHLPTRVAAQVHGASTVVHELCSEAPP